MSRPSVLDGPLQKQIMLMKLEHEMKNRPLFGVSYNDDPDGEIRQWISRVGAIMDRHSLSRGVEFRAIGRTLVHYWQPAIKNMLICVQDAIEEIKLEFELYREDQIGVVYQQGEEYAFKRDILEVIESSEKEIFVVDPYFDSATFTWMFSGNSKAQVRIFCSQYFVSVQKIIEEFKRSFTVGVEVRSSKQLHDRLIVVDGSDCWVVGASIKDAGKKPTYLLPLIPDLASRKIRIFDDLWKNS